MTFIPPRVAISSITQANPCVVTTSLAHNLSTGQVVRLHVPQNYGMFQLNNGSFLVTVLSPTTFSLQYSQIPPGMNVNSINYPAFTIPSRPSFTAEVVPMGAGVTPLVNTVWQINNNTCVTSISDATQNVATSNQPF